MICSMSFSTTTLYVEQSAGNPFINYFIQSMSELPAYFIGMFLSKLVFSVAFTRALCILYNIYTKLQLIELVGDGRIGHLP